MRVFGSSRLLVIAYAIIASSVAQGGLATRPVARQPNDIRRQVRDGNRARIEQTATADMPYKLSDLIHFSCGSGRLEVPWSGILGPTINGRHLRLAESAGSWDVTVNPYRYDALIVGLMHYNFGEDDSLPWMTSISVNTRAKALSMGATFGPAAPLFNVTYIQSNGAVRLIGNDTNVQKFDISAPDLKTLRIEHPAEVRNGLRPLLIQLTGDDILMPGDADYFLAFLELAPTPQATAQVQALLKRLDAAVYEDREAASQSLAKLGPPGLLALMRLDWNGFSAEQQARAAAWVEANRRCHFASAAEALADKSFLLDALEAPDQNVRTAAHHALEHLIHREIPFNPALSGDALFNEVDNIRGIVAGLDHAPPATAPIEGNTGLHGPVN